jgi:hypothetical protein
MSGRAGRRGKDERGIRVIMIDEKVRLCSITLQLSLIFLINFKSTTIMQMRFGLLLLTQET